MAAPPAWRSLQAKCCLLSSLRGSHSQRYHQLVKPLFSLSGLQAAQRKYSNSTKNPSESEEDPRNKPIRFSTSKARFMKPSQTLGFGAVEIDENPSRKSLYVGFFITCVLFYIIFLLPPDEDELDLLELEIEKEEKAKGKQ